MPLQNVLGSKALSAPFNDPDTGFRYYETELNHERFLSVTQVCSIISDPKVPVASPTRLKQTAQVGKRAHELFADDLMGRPLAVDPDRRAHFDLWLKYKEAHKLKPIYVETPVYSDSLGIAGTMDLFAEFTSCSSSECCRTRLEAEPSVLDYKTGFYQIKTGMQLAAYARALQELTGLKKVRIIGAQIHRDGKTARSFIYDHYGWCLGKFVAFLEAFKAIHYKKLKEANYRWLHESAWEEVRDLVLSDLRSHSAKPSPTSDVTSPPPLTL